MSSLITKLFTTPIASSQDPKSELEHINREMYVKNLELAERNKTLSFLRQIDEIIIASVTNSKEIASQVTRLLVSDADFKLACISLIDIKTKSLNRIGLTESKSLEMSHKQVIPSVSYNPAVSLTNTQYAIVQAISERTIKATAKLTDILLYTLSDQDATKIQELSGIKSFVVYPLSVRGEIIGTLVVGVEEEVGHLSDFHQDLLNRLLSAVGIALDNSVLYNEVQESNKKLQELDKLKDDFVSLASHELRTPMTAIKSYLWMALDGRGGPLTQKQKYYLDRSYKSTDRLINLVNDMLNISRIESGRITLEKSPITVSEIIKEVVEEISQRAQDLGIKLLLPPSPALPQVFVDINKIKEVLLNLIGNSLKFTPRGGSITVATELKDLYIVIKVTDTGVGIIPEDQPKLFQKFGMLMTSYSNSAQIQGTGLGLYISKKIVELHNGQIGITSDGKDKGTTFFFTLPIATQKDVEIYHQTPKDPNALHIGLEHVKI